MLLFSSGFFVLLPGTASAGQITSRKIVMSSSAPSATGVTYTLTFTPATTQATPGIVINFCNIATDPIPGDTCSGTPGTDIPSLSSVASACATGWTCSSIDSGQSLKLTTTTVNFTSGTAVTIPIAGVTNMSNVAGFYARVLVYASATALSSDYQGPTNPGGYQDYGGIALSTTNNINIISKVFETLSFCVYTGSCGATAPSIQLGDPTTGALSDTTAYVNSSAQYTIATNASQGANVQMTGTTLCRSTGANCATGASAYTITAMGATAIISDPTTEQFGMCVDSNSLPSNYTINATYLDTSAAKCHSLGTGTYSGSAKFGFNDSTTLGSGTNSASGSQVMSSTVPISSYSGTFAFLGNISTTTEAGIYQTALNMVATGTF